jgi:hypothetical protein
MWQNELTDACSTKVPRSFIVSGPGAEKSERRFELSFCQHSANLPCMQHVTQIHVPEALYCGADDSLVTGFRRNLR